MWQRFGGKHRQLNDGIRHDCAFCFAGHDVTDVGMCTGCHTSIIKTLAVLHFAECRPGSELRDDHVAGAGAGAADLGQHHA